MTAHSPRCATPSGKPGTNSACPIAYLAARAAHPASNPLRKHQTLEFNNLTVQPGLVEFHPSDGSQNIDTTRSHADLENHIRRFQVFYCQSGKGCPQTAARPSRRVGHSRPSDESR